MGEVSRTVVPVEFPMPLKHQRRHRILHEVCKHFDVPIQKLMGKCKSNSLVGARHCAMWLLRQMDYSFAAIGVFMSRDHSTVMHACRVAPIKYADQLAIIQFQIAKGENGT